MKAKRMVATLLLCAAGCGDAGTPDGWVRHEDRRGFSIAYPADWSSEQRMKDGIYYMFMVASPPDPGTGLRRVFNVVVHRNEPYEDRQKLSETAPAAARSFLSRIEVLHSEWTTLDGEEAYHHVSEGEVDAEGASLRWRVGVYATIHGSRVYTMTAHCAAARAAECEPELEQIAQSLRFKN